MATFRKGEGKFAPSGTTFIQWLAQLPYMLRGSSLFRFMATVLERAQGEVLSEILPGVNTILDFYESEAK